MRALEFVIIVVARSLGWPDSLLDSFGSRERRFTVDIERFELGFDCGNKNWIDLLFLLRFLYAMNRERSTFERLTQHLR